MKLFIQANSEIGFEVHFEKKHVLLNIRILCIETINSPSTKLTCSLNSLQLLFILHVRCIAYVFLQKKTHVEGIFMFHIHRKITA